jgi:hypothetical protein
VSTEEFHQAGAAGQQARLRRRDAVFGAAFCGAVPLLSLPTAFLVESGFPTVAVVAAAVGIVFALCCLLASWERAPLAVVHALPAVATVLLAVDAVVVDPSYGFYLVIVAGFVAFLFTDPRWVALHLALILAAIAAPAVIESSASRDATAAALLYVPGALLIVALGYYVRHRVDARERAYRQFGLDALAITARIRSTVGGDEEATQLSHFLHRHRSEGPRRATWRPRLRASAAAVPWRLLGTAAAVAGALVVVGALIGTGADDGSRARVNLGPVVEVPSLPSETEAEPPRNRVEAARLAERERDREADRGPAGAHTGSKPSPADSRESRDRPVQASQPAAGGGSGRTATSGGGQHGSAADDVARPDDSQPGPSQPAPGPDSASTTPEREPEPEPEPEPEQQPEPEHEQQPEPEPEPEPTSEQQQQEQEEEASTILEELLEPVGLPLP